ncbi:MAG: hypothetical protein ACXVLQ_06750 [Bacteriovorax sp.]
MKIEIILVLLILPFSNVKAGFFDSFFGKKEDCLDAIVAKDESTRHIEMSNKIEKELSIISLYSLPSDSEIEKAFIDEFDTTFDKICSGRTTLPEGNIIESSCKDSYRVIFPKINGKLKVESLHSDVSKDHRYRTIVQLECVKNCLKNDNRKEACVVDEKSEINQNNSGRNIIKIKEENSELKTNNSSTAK